jgi:hypothetical protein
VHSSDESSLSVIFNQWTEGLIEYIHIDAIDLEVYDVYWGTGDTMSIGNATPTALVNEEWILGTGFWDDSNQWDDTALWID